jgi:hypothetical protein
MSVAMHNISIATHPCNSTAPSLLVEVEVTLRLTVSQSVSMSWYRVPLWDLRPGIISCRNVAVWNLRSCVYWAPSLTRGRVCNLQCNHSLVRVAQNPKPNFTVLKRLLVYLSLDVLRRTQYRTLPIERQVLRFYLYIYRRHNPYNPAWPWPSEASSSLPGPRFSLGNHTEWVYSYCIPISRFQALLTCLFTLNRSFTSLKKLLLGSGVIVVLHI